MDVDFNDVARLHQRHYGEAIVQLGGSVGSASMLGPEFEASPEVDRLAASLADEQTRREVGPRAWQAFTNQRALSRRLRPGGRRSRPGRLARSVPRESPSD